MSAPRPAASGDRWPSSREALLRATMSLTVDQRIDWLEQMMLIAIETGALPKPVPDQLRSTKR